MPAYNKNEARDWANENLVGCSSVTIPSYSADLSRLNPAGIRHDVQKVIDLGFTYTLLCTEVAITPQENAEFTAIAKEVAGDRMGFFFHAGFGTLEENIAAVKLAEKAGADIVLLSYPATSGRRASRKSTTTRRHSAMRLTLRSCSSRSRFGASNVFTQWVCRSN